MKHIKCTIEGVTPLLCNRFHEEAQQKATDGKGSSTIGNPGTPREIAEKKLYLGLNKKPMIPQPNIFKCIIEGGKYFKAGRVKVTTMKTSIIPACLSLVAAEVPIIHKEPWTIDTRPVRIPATGGRVLEHRPCFHDWKLTFDMDLDEDIMDSRVLRDIVDAAGKRVGLGDYRPDNKGPFGKFVVTLWKENS